MAKIKINQEKCIGCGACVSSAPELLEVDETTRKAKVKKLIIGFLFVGLSFVVGTPYSLIDFSSFVYSLKTPMAVVASGQFIRAAEAADLLTGAVVGKAWESIAAGTTGEVHVGAFA